jgi:hypothetical protein
MLATSASLVLQAAPAPPLSPTSPVIPWIIGGLLLLLVLLLILLGFYSFWYKRWLNQDAEHKRWVEQQLGQIADALDRLADDRTDKESLPTAPVHLAPQRIRTTEYDGPSRHA